MAKRNSAANQAFDWRDRAFYQYTDKYTDRSWAWEGLRRNHEFQAAWRESASCFEIRDIENDIKLVNSTGRKSGLTRWGVLYSDSPDVDAGHAAVVWQAEFAHTLDAVALPLGASPDAKAFRLSDARCSTLVVHTPDGYQHVLLYSAGCGMQLRVKGANVLEPTHLLTDAAPDTPILKSRLQTLALLDELRTKGRCEAGVLVPKARAERLRLVMQALDGFLARATLREIAVALFGEDRVARDWDDDHRHLKDRVRRAVARGRWLMEGGYKKYLK